MHAESDPRFKEQTIWELDQQKRADVVAVCLLPGTEAPVSLLELGLAAQRGVAVVCCPEEFARRGNVEIVCARLSLPLVETLDEFIQQIMGRLTR